MTRKLLYRQSVATQKGTVGQKGKIWRIASEEMTTSRDSQYWEHDCQEDNTPNPIVAPPALIVTPESRKISPFLESSRIVTRHTSIFNLLKASSTGLLFASTVTSSKVWTVGADDMAWLFLNRVSSSIAHRMSFSSLGLQSK